MQRSNTKEHLTGVAFTEGTGQGYVVGVHRTVLRTVDDGATWNKGL